MSHKGKATSDITYNKADPPEVYTNPTIQPRITRYNTMAREIHGPEFDPKIAPLSGEAIVRMGGGKKHGQYFVVHSLLNQMMF